MAFGRVRKLAGSWDLDPGTYANWGYELVKMNPGENYTFHEGGGIVPQIRILGKNGTRLRKSPADQYQHL